MKKKLSLLTLAACLTLSGIPTIPVQAEANYAYTPETAIQFAKEHIAKELETNTVCDLVCDQFVKECLSAANVNLRAGGVEAVKDALVQAGFGTAHKLNVASDDIHITKADNPTIKAGDIMFIFCEDCDTFLHTALISGFDADGNMLAYGHNPIWDAIDWFGNMTHTTDDGKEHKKCYQFYAVSMDTTPTTHQHKFKQDLYEAAHPHKMYDECDCGTKYYLGWNAKVSSCTVCNPVTSAVPVLTAEYKEAEGSVALQWTPVENVVNYELYRAKSADGTFFKIATTEGVKISNKSVENGNTYYYKVKAVRANDADSVYSDVVSVAVGKQEQKPEETKLAAPEATGYIRDDNGKPRITWNAVSGAEQYEVYRSENGGAYTKVTTTKYTSYTNTGAEAGKTYSYKVKAISGSKASDYSNAVTLTLKLQTAAPTATGYIRDDNGKPRITWNAVSGADRYEVYRSENGGAYTKVTTTKYTSYTNTGAKAGKTYSYKVKAIFGSTASDYSNAVTLTLGVSAPTATGYIRDDNGKPRITWKAVSGAEKYEVYRSENGGAYTKVTTTKYTSYTNTSAKAGRTYSYKVKAICGNNASDYSNAVTLTLGVPAPEATGYIRNDNNKPRITWKAVSGAEKYEVYRSENGGAYTKVTTTKYTSYTNTSAKAGRTYSYKVKAICGNNASDYSNAVTLTLELTTPEVSGYIRTDNNKPRITWKAVSGAEKYEVYRSENGGAYKKVTTTKYTSYTNTSAKAGKTYSYKVKAIYGTNESSFSNVISFTVK